MPRFVPTSSIATASGSCCAPSSQAAWILPFAALALGVAALVTWLARRRPAPVAPKALDEATRRRLHDEAEALDA